MTRKSPPRVLLAVEAEHPALDVAIVLAEDWAGDVQGELIILVVPMPSDVPEALRRRQASVAKRVEQLTGRNASGVKAARGHEGRPGRIIVSAAEAQRAERIVVALRPQSRWAALLKSSVLDEILRSAGQPVLVARATKESGSVLLAADLASPDEAAISLAAAEAARRGVGLNVLHCFVGEAAFRRVRTHPLDEELQDVLLDPRLRVKKQGGERVAKIARAEGVSTVDLVFAEGDVTKTILQAVERIRPELVVVGARRPAHRHLFRRGTAARIAKLAPCPVLVVPERGVGQKRRAGETPASSYTAGQT